MGVLGTLGAIGGAILGSGAIPSVVGGLFDSRNTDKTNQANKDINADVNASNERIANQNLEFQRENLEYQKALQQQIFEREDTAYERTVQDMRNAGLSPLSMQSTNGAGEAIATNALHNDFQAQGYQAQKANTGEIVANALGAGLAQLSEQIYQRDNLRAQAEKTQAEAENIKINNGYQALLLEEQLRGARVGNARNFQDLFDKGRQIDYEQHFGIVGGMTEMERTAQILAKSLGFSTTPEKTGSSWYTYNDDGNVTYNRRSDSSFDSAGVFYTGLRALTGLADFLPAKDIFSLARGIGRSKKYNSKGAHNNESYQSYLDDILPF